MRLHRLSVRDYKGIAARDVEFPEAGILVLEGPNEVGKSTMLDALDLVLDHKDSSRRAQIRAAQPIGRDVGPGVEVELSTGAYRFSYRKQWLRQPSTELHILAPTRAHLVGDEAHERVRAILAETADLHLWKALRLMQTGPLVQEELAGSSALAAALDEAAGTTPDVGGAAESLLAAAEATCLRYFTARTAAPTGEYRAAIERLEAADAAVEAARERLREVADDVERHESLETQLRAARAQLGSARREADRWEGEAARAREVGEELATARRRRDEAAAVLEREQERRADRQEAEADLAARRAALDEARARLEELREHWEPTRAEHDRMQAEVVNAARAAQDARRDLDRATARVARARDAADLTASRKRLAAVVEAEAQISGLRAELALHPVDAGILREIESASQAAELAAASHAAGSAAVLLRALGGARSLVVDGRRIDLAEGDAWQGALTEPLDIRLPGVLDLELRPEAGAADRARSVQRARDTLADRLRAAGVGTIDEARASHDRRRDLEADLTGALARLRALLDGQSRDDLADRVEVLEVRLAACSAAEADVAGATRSEAASDERGLAGVLDASPDDAAESSARSAADSESESTESAESESAAVSESAAEAAASATEAAPASAADSESAPSIAQATEAETAARERLDAARERAQALGERVETMRVELTRADSLVHAVAEQVAGQESRLESARQARSAQALESAQAAAADALAQAQREVDAASARVGTHDAQALTELAAASAAEVNAVRGRLREAESELIRVQARLNQAGGQGRAESYDAARTEHERARREHDRVRRHAEAARLLRDTLASRSKAAKRAYVQPFGDAVCRLGRIVYGPSFDVEVDDDLTIRARVLDGLRVPYGALSTGAKEQLAILTRLACASIVDPQQGVPVVIDDALGYSDPEKLRRVCAAVGRLGTRAQVVLLTCTPGRYAAIPQAQVVRL